MTNRSTISSFRIVLVSAALITAAALVNGQAPASAVATPSPSPAIGSAPAPQPAPQASPTPPTLQPKVIGIEGHLELDYVIRVEVQNLNEWAKTNDATKLVPFLDGRALRGLYPEEIHPDQQRLHFHLEISAANKERWTDLLGEPNGTKRNVTFTVGLENQSPFDTVYNESKPLPLTVISPVYGIISLIVVASTLILFVMLAYRTNIIREPGPNPGGGKLKPYNLGRTQMAFWFFLVYASYITIWLITNSLDTITASLLGLMGISAGTALSEALIDTGKDTAQGGKLTDLSAERQSLEQSINDLQAQQAALDTTAAPSSVASLNKQLTDSRTRLAQVSQQLETLTPAADANVSKGFLQDILGDANGYSFHRFQIFAWTIVLGIIFVSSVYNSLTMPEFSATLLGLMGLSSGTYIGFKFPEQKQ
ncbi:MAG TPA: hypothetical protein VLL54_14975 [Pyrinomonadaceae bacterium]|nr:hypothetical protein [Pyrinomonadaceae bacterium]